MEEKIKTLKNEVDSLRERVIHLENQNLDKNVLSEAQNIRFKSSSNSGQGDYTFASQTALEKQASEEVKKDENERKGIEEIYPLEKVNSNRQKQLEFKTSEAVNKVRSPINHGASFGERFQSRRRLRLSKPG